MATGFNPTTGAAFLQHFYSPGFVQNSVTAKASKIRAMCKKMPNGGGDFYTYLTSVDDVATGSADFATAQAMAANSTSTIGSQFLLGWMESDEPVRVAGKIMAQTRNNNAAWTQALKYAMDSGLRIAAHRLSVAFYTRGFGELAQLASVSGATFKCLEPSHIFRFFKGQQLVYSSSLDAAVLRSATAQTITAIDYANNLITMSGNLSVPGGANNDWAFTAGDRQNSATPAMLRPVGLDTYFPDPTAAAADTNLSVVGGVNRANNTRLYGQFTDATNMSIEDGLIDLLSQCIAVGNAEDSSGLVAVIGFQQHAALTKQLGTNRRYVEVPGSKGYVGFKTLALQVNGLDIPILSDRYCETPTGFVIAPKEFEIASLGQAPRLDNDGGVSPMLKISDDNGVEVRIVSYTQHGSKNPAICGRIKMPSLT